MRIRVSWTCRVKASENFNLVPGINICPFFSYPINKILVLCLFEEMHSFFSPSLLLPMFWPFLDKHIWIYFSFHPLTHFFVFSVLSVVLPKCLPIMCYVCLCVHREHVLVLYVYVDIFSNCSPPHILRHNPSLNLELPDSASPAVPNTPGIYLSLPPQCRDCIHVLWVLAF